MRVVSLSVHALMVFLLTHLLTSFPAHSAIASPAILKAKQEAEAKGYAFFTNRDEIVSKAKKEGKLRVVTGLVGSIQATTEAFRKRYPFIDLHVEELKGGDLGPRALLQVQAGAAKDSDIMRTHTDIYSQWLPHLWKADLLGMAEHGVLDIHPQMIDPKNRNVMALVSRFSVVPYNKNLVSPGQVPKSWEDMLKPEWKGRKFAVDIRPQEFAALVPAWGLEKTLDYARKIVAQEPIWARGGTRVLIALAAGEIPLYLFGSSYHSVIRLQRKDPLGVIQYTVLEPVPLRVGVEQAILATSRNPHAALLWMEFIAGSEAQKLIDEHEPLTASVYSKDSAAEQALKGKKLSVVSWEHNEKMEQWIAKLVEAYGFPKAQ
ncbi:MAG: ABC transporter substrate-binding protein [Deltaproteobacteria bacterium]|nr:ABC transporter substrate-binding protein [Deltaproteobacteria bacterium]